MEIILVVNTMLALLLGLFVFSLLTPSGRNPVRKRRP